MPKNNMFGKIREIIEARRESKNIFWKFLYSVKDLAYKTAVSLKIREPGDFFAGTVYRKLGKVPAVFVETGTYNGGTTCRVLREFREIHTIELSEKWYKNAVREFENYKNVFCHYGDSAQILAKILPTINEPVIFYLDAHYSGGTTALGQDQNPLLRELKIIGQRNFEDIIFIDDLEQMGKSGIMGTEGHAFYPPTKFDWQEITKESIENALGKKIIDCEEKENKLIIWKLGNKDK